MNYDDLPKSCYECKRPAKLYRKVIPAKYGEQEYTILRDLCDSCANTINCQTHPGSSAQYIPA